MIFALKGKELARSRLLRPPESDVDEWDALVKIAKQVGGAARVVSVDGGNGTVLTDDRAPVERLTDRTIRRESRTVLGE